MTSLFFSCKSQSFATAPATRFDPPIPPVSRASPRDIPTASPVAEKAVAPPGFAADLGKFAANSIQFAPDLIKFAPDLKTVRFGLEAIRSGLEGVCSGLNQVRFGLNRVSLELDRVCSALDHASLRFGQVFTEFGQVFAFLVELYPAFYELFLKRAGLTAGFARFSGGGANFHLFALAVFFALPAGFALVLWLGPVWRAYGSCSIFCRA